jgi:molecular chaperone GrpE
LSQEVEAELQAARQEIAELKDKYLRAAASIDNARKQAERDAASRVAARLRVLYLRLLDVVDNLERALTYAADDDPLAPGVRATRELLLDILRKEGVGPIEVSAGDPFDPEFQEAIETREGPVDEPRVAEVRSPGYTFEGRILRPARVSVLKLSREPD